MADLLGGHPEAGDLVASREGGGTRVTRRGRLPGMQGTGVPRSEETAAPLRLT